MFWVASGTGRGLALLPSLPQDFSGTTDGTEPLLEFKLVLLHPALILQISLRSRNIGEVYDLVFSFSFHFIFIADTITDAPFPTPPPLLAITQPLSPLPSGHHHTVVSVCGLCIYDFWLILSPSFIQFSPPPQLSACSMFPCFCFYFTGHETTKTHYQTGSFPMHCYSSNSLDLLN